MPELRKSATRHKLGIRIPRWQDRRCRKHGHVLSEKVSVGMLSGVFWPLCERCGYAIEPARQEFGGTDA